MNISQVEPNTASKERKKMDVPRIQDLYDEGKFPEAMSAVMAEIEERESDDPELSELYAICAWCHYRRKEWDDVREWLEKAGDTLRAKRLRAYMAAYEDKDDSTLSAIANELGDDVGMQNALVIRARDPGSGLVAIDDLSGILMRFVGKDEVDVANLFHNAARLFFAKGNTPDHFKAALNAIESAIIHYGTNAHWHHRATAEFWRGKILEEIVHEARVRSAELWHRASELDPDNETFKYNLENAQKLAREL